MIVELVGPPGAGKSTVLPSLAVARGCSTVNFDRELDGNQPLAWLFGLLRNPLVAASVLPAGRRGWVRSMLNVTVRDLQLGRLDGDVMVDDGPLHLLSWLGAFVMGEESARRAARRLRNRPDGVLLLEVDPIEALRRVHEREGEGRRHVVHRVGRKAALDGNLLYGRVIRSVTKEIGVPLEVLDDSGASRT